jgi:hypothetical protein
MNVFTSNSSSLLVNKPIAMPIIMREKVGAMKADGILENIAIPAIAISNNRMPLLNKKRDPLLQPNFAAH